MAADNTIQSLLTVEAFIHEPSSTVSYLILDETSRACAILDSVLDFDAKSGRTATHSANRILARIAALRAMPTWILETHIHADHLSAAPYLRAKTGARTAIGAHIITVQHTFGRLFNAGNDFAQDGSQFDHLLPDNANFAIGGLRVTALHTPGHTPACMTYVIDDGQRKYAFVGDTLFMPDYGTARCDFPGGDAHQLYRSIRRVLSLPPDTALYMCHDYRPGGRPFCHLSTVADQRRHNIHVHDGVSEDAFASMRHQRDATLDMPALMLPSVQVNMRAGALPEAESNGIRYLKIPLDAL